MSKLIKKVFLSIISLLGTIAYTTSVSAETVIQQKTGSLTIRYFDDSEETIPATGAEYTIYQVATLGMGLMDNGAYIPLGESVRFDDINVEQTDENNEVPEFTHEQRMEYQQAVINLYESNPEIGYTETVKIDEEGIGFLDELPLGAYFVVETKTLRYHKTPEPFLVSIPETKQYEDGSNLWNYDVVCNPKQILAGDLTITKKVDGMLATELHNKQDLIAKATSTMEHDSDEFTIQVDFSVPSSDYNITDTTFSNMTFEATLPDGTTQEVGINSQFKIHKGETIFIADVPAGIQYKVTEIEANKTPYETTYKDNEGVVVEKTATAVTVINSTTKWYETHKTGVGEPVVVACIVGGLALTILLFLLLTSKKDKEK